MTGRILPPLTAILPLWLVRSMVPWRQTREVWPALAVSGLSFAGMQYYWSNHQETNLVDIVAAMFSLLVMVAFLKIWKPKSLLENKPQEAAGGTNAGGAIPERVWSFFLGREAKAFPCCRLESLVALHAGFGFDLLCRHGPH
jgi:lactate permease